MQIKSILNRIEKVQGFVYGVARWCIHNGGRAIVITVRWPKPILTSVNDQQTYYFAKPIKTTKICLLGHGNPQDAPHDLRDIYATEDG